MRKRLRRLCFFVEMHDPGRVGYPRVQKGVMQRPCLETRVVRRHVITRDNDDAHIDIVLRQEGDVPALVDHDLDNEWRQGRFGHFELAAANRAQDDVDVLSSRDDAPADHPVDRSYVVEVGWKSIKERADQAERAGQQGAEPE